MSPVRAGGIPGHARRYISEKLVNGTPDERKALLGELNHQLDEIWSIGALVITATGWSGGGIAPRDENYLLHGVAIPASLPNALLHRNMAGADLHWPKVHGDAYHDAAHGETPAGAIDDANKAFTLASAPSPSGSLMLILQNVPQMNRALAGAGAPAADMMGWYSLAGNTITYEVAPLTGFTHLAWYWH